MPNNMSERFPAYLANSGLYPLTAFKTGSGAFDAHAALMNFFATADAGTEVFFDPTVTYDFDAAASVSDRDVSIDFRAALVQRSAAGSDRSILSINHSYSLTTAVTSVALGTQDFGNTNPAVISVVTVGSGAAILSSLTVGSRIKIVGDDLIPSSPTADAERVGEHAYVMSVSGTSIYLDRVLRETYTTNVRIALGSRYPVHIKNPNMADIGASYRSRSAIDITGADRPRVTNAQMVGLKSSAIAYRSCSGAVTRGAELRDLETQENNNRFGYGIFSVGSNDGQHTGLLGENCRHVYTTGARTVSANNADVSLYGGAVYDYVKLRAINCRGAGFDTHADALGIIAKVVVLESHNGDNSSEACVQLRGRRCHVEAVTRGLTGFRMISSTADDGDHYVKINHSRPRMGQIAPAIDIIGHTANKIDIDARIIADGDMFAGIQATNAEVVVNDLTLRNPGSDVATATVGNRVFELVNSALHFKNLHWDARGGGNERLTPRLARVDATSRLTGQSGSVWTAAKAFNTLDMVSGAGVAGIDKLVTDTVSNGMVGIVSAARAWVNEGRPQDPPQARQTKMAIRTNDADVTLNPSSPGILWFQGVTLARNVIVTLAQAEYDGLAVEGIFTGTANGYTISFNTTGGTVMGTLSAPGRLRFDVEADTWYLVPLT